MSQDFCFLSSREWQPLCMLWRSLYFLQKMKWFRQALINTTYLCTQFTRTKKENATSEGKQVLSKWVQSTVHDANLLLKIFIFPQEKFKISPIDGFHQEVMWPQNAMQVIQHTKLPHTKLSLILECEFSNSLIIHEAKTKENHKRELAKLSPSFSPEARICLRSCIKHSH